ncbi:MAG: DUF2191 domain-containing protein [Deltaproteobacteria bacterium]|nr:DUF2191 domain-containing protein [Deltaproteobacteria bacterium]
MKTTVDINDSLLEDVRRQAAAEKTSVKALIEEALRRIMNERKQEGRFRLRKAAFKGNGLQAPVADAPWEHIRDMSYEGRGG